MLVKAAKTLDSDIVIEKDDSEKRTLATKLMAVMGLGVKCGDTVRVTIEGGNEDASLAAMKEFLKPICERTQYYSS